MNTAVSSLGQWNSFATHEVKRALSRFEKAALSPTPNCKALIMPASPGTEVEELVDVGFNPSNIYGIERDFDIAEYLYNYYRDKCNIHYDEVDIFLQASKNLYTYIHLDWCGFLQDAEINAMSIALHRLDNSLSRLRCSFALTRRGDKQRSYEQRMWRHLTRALCSITDIDHEPFYNFDFNSSQLCTLMIFVEVTFNITPWIFVDMYLQNEVSTLTNTPLQNRKVIHSYHFLYREPRSRTLMSTCWSDIVRQSRTELIEFDQHFRSAQIQNVLQSVTTPTPRFTKEHAHE